MNCPRCQVALSISDRQGVEIDFCPQCRGVWLDRGELDKIIDRATNALASATPAYAPPPERSQPMEEPSYDDRRGGKRRKRNFFEDLFDFD